MPLKREESSALMDRAAAGDGGAFATLATGMQDALYRFARAHGLRRADAAEAVQETLLRAYRGRRRWRRGADAGAWLYGIAMNVVREFRRKRGRQASLTLDPAMLPAAGDQGVTGERAERLRRLAEAIGLLPPRQREAVTCRYLRRMSIRDTAAAMGCAEGTVKAAAFAALKNLRKLMDEDR